MPIYEYVCQNCGFELEKLQKVSDPALTKCPNCDQDQLTKQVSAAGFRLKGGGWYETDFKSDKEKKRNLATTDSKTDSKTESKTDSKSANKSSSKKTEA